MGVRINCFADHDVRPFHDVARVLWRLESATEAALAVRAYWRARSPESRSGVTAWVAEPERGSRSGYYRAFEGPGHLYLKVSDRTLRISTGGRWRGFLEIEPLRRVHLAAFREIVGALGGSHLAICADQDDVFDAFLLRATPDECAAVMHRLWGDPLPPSEPGDPVRSPEDRRGVWFSETIVRGR